MARPVPNPDYSNAGPNRDRNFADRLGASQIKKQVEAAVTTSSPAQPGEIDFGAIPRLSASMEFLDASVSEASIVAVFPADGDEHEFDSVSYSAVPGVGSFMVYAKASGPVSGVRSYSYKVF